MKDSRLVRRFGGWIALAGALMAGSGTLIVVVNTATEVHAATLGTGTGISYNLEGCRGSVADYVSGASTYYVPAPASGGTFVCNSAGDYTPGNLG